MALKGMEMGLFVVLVTVLWAGAAAQTSCTNAIISMSPCLNYITGNSSTPSSSCCSQLQSVVTSEPQCLCEVLNGGAASMGLNINRTLALALPGVCKVQTPPLSRCNSTPQADSPAGNPTTPSVPGGDSYGSSTKVPFPLLVFLLFVASYASTFSSL